MRRLSALAAAALLAGCGGGLYLSIGDEFDTPPDVSLVVDDTSASPGQTLRFVAAASDDFGVDRVALYRRESNGSATLVATDASAPWEWSVGVATDFRGELRYFARATDGAGQDSDSQTVAITVR